MTDDTCSCEAAIEQLAEENQRVVLAGGGPASCQRLWLSVEQSMIVRRQPNRLGGVGWNLKSC
jgi:hypothetical protein